MQGNQVKLRTYKKELEYTYALGASVTIELLENRARDCFRVICSPTFKDKTKIFALCEQYAIPIEENQRLINMLSPKENCYLIGAFHKRAYSLEDDKPHIIVDNPSDMGNIGTIMRSCAGFNMPNLAVINGGADAYNPKVIRASMGAFFHVNLEYFGGIHEYLAAYGNKRKLYAFMLDAKDNLTSVTPPSDNIYSLIFGNEATGLDNALYKDISTGIYIHHESVIDSLSLPTAASIALFWFDHINPPRGYCFSHRRA